MPSDFEIILFIDITPISVLIFLEIFSLLKLLFQRIKVLPVKNKFEIFEHYRYFNKSIIFLILVNERDRELQYSGDLIENRSKFYFEEGKNLNCRKFFKSNNLEFFEKFFIQRSLSLTEFNLSNYYRNYIPNFFCYLEKLKKFDNSRDVVEKYVWIKSIITWYLFLSKKFNWRTFFFCFKKMFRIFKKYHKNRKNMSIQIKSQEMIFSKELPLYFLNHNTIIESFLNTPFVLLNFELWKKNGFKKMFQFFGKIFIFREDTEKTWLSLKKKKRTIITECFELETKKFNTIPSTVYVFKKSMKTVKNLTEVTSFDMSLVIKSIFDKKIKRLETSPQKKNFWKGFDSVVETKTVNKYIEIEKETQKFVSRMSRIVLAKKIFISRKNMRIIYLSDSKLITYRRIEGLLKFFISVFKKNKLIQKFLLLIVKEENFNILFLSHQNKNFLKIFNDFFTIKKFAKMIQIVNTKEKMIILKFPRIIEREIIRELSNIN